MRIVQAQWNAVWTSTESSQMKLGFARTLMLNLLRVFPEATELFKDVGIDNPLGGRFSAHCMRIVNAFDMLINLLDSPDSLDEALDHLAVQHGARPGVRVGHIHVFGQLLSLGLLQILDDYDAMAWKSCWKGIVKRMTSGVPI